VSQQINLFNPIFLKQKKYFSAVTMVQALGLILVGAIALTSYVSVQLFTLQAEAENTNKQLRTAQAQLAKVTAEYAPKQKSKALESEVKEAEAKVLVLQRVFEVLKKGEFGNTDGYAEYFRALARQIDEGVWLTGFYVHGAGTELGLKGRALQPDLVPAYISRLKREPVMQGKSFAALEMQSGESASAGKEKPGGTAGSGYIEFNLRSAGIDKADAQQAGAIKK